MKKVRKQGAGSSLLTDPTTLYKLLAAMKKNTHLPIAAKIRVEGNSIKVYLNGVLEFDLIDNSFSQGAIGLGSNWNSGVYFDDVSVTDMSSTTLFADNFNDGNLDGWTIYDDPDAVPDEGPGCWFVTE